MGCWRASYRGRALRYRERGVRRRRGATALGAVQAGQSARRHPGRLTLLSGHGFSRAETNAHNQGVLTLEETNLPQWLKPPL